VPKFIAYYPSPRLQFLPERNMSRFHDLTMESITGEPVSFSDFQGKRCLIVNVASR
jgi:hypothetical protein